MYEKFCFLTKIKKDNKGRVVYTHFNNNNKNNNDISTRTQKDINQSRVFDFEQEYKERRQT